MVGRNYISNIWTMVGTKLDLLKQEIANYIGIPYFINSHHLAADNAFVGKGSVKEIALETVHLANLQNIKLLDFTSVQIYNFQKKNHLGIDCSGLACHLLNFYFGTTLDVRKTSANMLTSAPLSQLVTDIKTGDLIRQKDGKHVLFVIEKTNNNVLYVHSSPKNRGVAYGQFDITKPNIKFDGIYRLLLLN